MIEGAPGSFPPPIKASSSPGVGKTIFDLFRTIGEITVAVFLRMFLFAWGFVKFVIFAFFGTLLLAALFYLFTWYAFDIEWPWVKFGVTFSTPMARQLSLDERETFDAIVDDLGAKLIRLPVYWTDIEPMRGKFTFSEFDYFVKKAEGANVKIIPVVGRKLPRWPECHIPEWARELEFIEFEAAVQAQIKQVVARYKDSPAVIMWQIENEPFHVFGGDCALRKIESKYLDEEIAIVRTLDPRRPIMLTDSGEQGIWSTLLSRADVVGVTTYLQVWNEYFKYVYFPFGPGFYSAKKELFLYFYPDKKIIGAELQAEPWGPGLLLPDYPVELQKNILGLERFRANVSYARRIGYEVFYLWGAEWWYWLGKNHNDWEIWEEAKTFMK